jgi:hypothetical protein
VTAGVQSLRADIAKHGDYLVTVCDACLRASCWHGYYRCDAWRSAGTVDRRASELLAIGAEHPDKFSRATVLRECGEIRSAA